MTDQNKLAKARELSAQLTAELIARNESRFKAIAFVNRHEIIEALDALAALGEPSAWQRAASAEAERTRESFK